MVLAAKINAISMRSVRDTIGTAIYFSTYESTKQILVKLHGADSPTSPGSVAIAGGVCGLVSWACVDILNDNCAAQANPILDLPN